MTPRPFTWLLSRCLPNTVSGRSIVGDLHQEYQRKPQGLRRDIWYANVAARLAVRYSVLSIARSVTRRASNTTGVTSGLALEIRQTLRSFRRRPSYVLTAVITLALGIGLTSSIYSVVDAVMYRPLPYTDPDRLVTVWNTYPTWRGHEVLDRLWDRIPLSYPEYVDWRDGNDVFTDVAIYGPMQMTLTGHGQPATLLVGQASPTLFPLLGITAARGRTFLPGEEGSNPPQIALLGNDIWRQTFGSQPSVLGRMITLNAKAYEIVGILPPGFELPSTSSGAEGLTPDVWVPVGSDGASVDRGAHRYEAIARLAPNTTIPQAEAASGPLLRGERTAERQNVRILPRRLEQTRHARAPVMLLFVASITLLLISCTSIATLMIGETARRRHEMELRIALGASRWRITRQVLGESTLLGVLGALIGAVLSLVGTKLLVYYAPAGLHLPNGIGPNARVLGFGIMLGLLTGVVFGTVPALTAGRTGVAHGLRTARGTGSLSDSWFQPWIIGTQFALCALLLFVAGLSIRTLVSVGSVDPGFQTGNLLTTSVSLPETRYDNASIIQGVTEMVEAFGAIPGVTDVAATTVLPLSGGEWSSSFTIEGQPVEPGEKQPEANRRNILPGYFRVMGIPILTGRTFNAADRADAPSVTLVSESLARHFWPNESPLGKRIVRDNRALEIIGIVGDVRHSNLTTEPQPTFYVPLAQELQNSVTFIVQSGIDPQGMAPLVREAVWNVDALIPVDEVESMSSLMNQAQAEERYRMMLLSVFGAIALILASVAIGGVTFRTVVLRYRELGIRAALGAKGTSLIQLVLRKQLVALGAGLGAGTILTFLVGGVFSRFLYGVDAQDPITLAAVWVLLIAVGLGASLTSARRVMTISPMQVLKD